MHIKSALSEHFIRLFPAEKGGGEVSACDGDLEDYYPYDANDSYTVSPELLNAARTAGEKLYFHFYHPAGTVGRIRLNVKDNTPTDLNQVLTPAPAAKLRLTTNGELYILRGTERYTITGQRY